LVDARPLVTAVKLRQFIDRFRPVVVLYDDLLRLDPFYRTVLLRYDADAGILRRLILHPRTHNGRGSGHQRNGLPLHIRAHQRAGNVIVFKERDKRSRYRNNLFRRNVHQIDFVYVIFHYFVFIPPRNLGRQKFAFFVNRRVRLRDDIIFFLIRGKVTDFLG
jgi:hypothetical protein